MEQLAPVLVVDSVKASFYTLRNGNQLFFRMLDALVCVEVSAFVKDWEVAMAGPFLSLEKWLLIDQGVVITGYAKGNTGTIINAYYLNSGELAWALELPFHVSKNLWAQGNGSFCLSGSQKGGQFMVAEISSTNGQILWIQDCKPFQYLHFENGNPVLAGVRGIRFPKEENAAPWEPIAIYASRLIGETILVVISEDRMNVQLLALNLGNKTRTVLVDLPSVEVNQYALLDAGGEVTFLRNTINNTAAIIRHEAGEWKIESLPPQEVGPQWSFSVSNGRYFGLFEIGESGDFEAMEMVTRHGSVAWVPQEEIEDPQSIQAFDNFLVVAGLWGTSIWEVGEAVI